MALICHPRLIVFDEPTTALDVTTQLDVLAAIKRMIKGENTAALYISHDLAVVSQIADDILVLRHGKAVEAAQTMTLIETPREDYTRRLLSADTPASKQRRLPIRKNRYWNCAMSQPPTETANRWCAMSASRYIAGGLWP